MMSTPLRRFPDECVPNWKTLAKKRADKLLATKRGTVGRSTAPEDDALEYRRILDSIKAAKGPSDCVMTFSAIARPILPFPSSNGCMDSKYKWAIPARVSGGNGAAEPGAVLANQSRKRSISAATWSDGGASK